ncbi:MAG TPA: hypothetical protein VN709_03010 [Terriglobales bacterium]|nr:hypothetical protein [Terriglobales bacterium]
MKEAEITNGGGAAALLAAGMGALALAILADGTDHSPALQKLMTFYSPTGPLSGVTTTALGIWLVSWFGLERAWAGRELNLKRITTFALGLTVLAMVLMFPPVSDLF